MSKVYLLAVNWEKMKTTDDKLVWLRSYDAHSGNDILGFTSNFDIKEWRVYAFTTKRERYNVVDNIFKKGDL